MVCTDHCKLLHVGRAVRVLVERDRVVGVHGEVAVDLVGPLNRRLKIIPEKI
jgi:hypothetical protein